MFYTYSQNNSGGGFDFSGKDGITNYVIVEADDAEQANYLAQRIGLYFDGIDQGLDCSYSGDRWHAQYCEGVGTEVPMVYNQPADGYVAKYGGWMERGKEIAVHYADGSIKWYGCDG